MESKKTFSNNLSSEKTEVFIKSQVNIDAAET